MWNKIKKVLMYVFIVLIAVFIFIVCRRCFIGRRVPGIAELIGLLRGGTEQVKEGLDVSTGLNEQAAGLAEQASESIKSAEGHCVTAGQAIRRARDILSQARARQSEK